MSFFTKTLSPAQQEAPALLGGNAPAVQIDHRALRVARRSPPATPLNAPAQGYRGVMAGSNHITKIQADVINARMTRKLKSGTYPGAASWIGLRFGG